MKLYNFVSIKTTIGIYLSDSKLLEFLYESLRNLNKKGNLIVLDVLVVLAAVVVAVAFDYKNESTLNQKKKMKMKKKVMKVKRMRVKKVKNKKSPLYPFIYLSFSFLFIKQI